MAVAETSRSSGKSSASGTTQSTRTNAHAALVALVFMYQIGF